MKSVLSREVLHGVGADGVGVKFPIWLKLEDGCTPLELLVPCPLQNSSKA